MKYIDEYREKSAALKFAELIRRTATRQWTIMEICGGQTHAIVKFGLETLLPPNITIVHGPGCPVCVTPIELIDRAVTIASLPNVILTSFGDMLRVPGSETDLFAAKAKGADVRIVYSPLDAVNIARKNPNKEVVFFAVGFETTAPANAMAVVHAKKLGVKNFSILCSHVLVPPAVEAILSADGNRVQALLAAGHVCAVMGTGEYAPLVEKYKVPIVVTGFEPIDLLQGLSMAVAQLEEGDARLENQYARTVRPEGNPAAREVLARVFKVTDRKWRGIGNIPNSGYALSNEYEEFDAEKKFDVRQIEAKESPLCIAGEVLKGAKRPHECSAFGTLCTPERPLGAPMVSSEGACAAYYHYGRIQKG